MVSPYRNKRPPFELPSDIVYFLDWRYVQHGNVGWKSPDGETVPMWEVQPSPPMGYEPSLGMVELPDKRMGIPYNITPVPHKHPRRLPFGVVGWAWWPLGRLAALEAPVEGSFALWPIKTTKRRISINFKSALGGSIRVQVMNVEGRPVKGRTLEDCDWLIGDHIEKDVSWRGDTDLANGENEPVTLFFQLRSAEIYSVEFK